MEGLKTKNNVYKVVLNRFVPACTRFQQLYIFLVLNKQRPVGEETENFTKEFTCMLVSVKPRLNDLTLLYNICYFNNVETPAKRFNIVGRNV